MKAAVHTSYGSPDVVRVIDVPKPTPRAGDVLIRIVATTVNRTDCAYRAAKPFFVRAATGLRRPRRTVLGTEFAGVVEEIGSAVTSFSPGDPVFGYCEGQFGAQAEYLAVPHDSMLAAMPPNVSFEQAAAATEGAHYAMAFLTRAQIRAGQDVLVNGATGAIGSAAVQLLKVLGAHVTAVCPAEHVSLVRQLGADRVIDCDHEDFTATAGSYDAVLDAVGKSTFARCRPLLRPQGVFSSSDPGPYWQNLPLAMITPLARRRRVVFPFPRQSAEIAEQLKDHLQSGHFTPLIDRRYVLDDIVDAYHYVESGRKVGNVVITVAVPS